MCECSSYVIIKMRDIMCEWCIYCIIKMIGIICLNAGCVIVLK